VADAYRVSQAPEQEQTCQVSKTWQVFLSGQSNYNFGTIESIASKAWRLPEAKAISRQPLK
jgi:hypothetical protein